MRSTATEAEFRAAGRIDDDGRHQGVALLEHRKADEWLIIWVRSSGGSIASCTLRYTEARHLVAWLDGLCL